VNYHQSLRLGLTFIPADGTAPVGATDTGFSLVPPPVGMTLAQPAPTPQPAPINQPFAYAPPPITADPIVAPPVGVTAVPVPTPISIASIGPMTPDPIFSPPLNVTAAPAPVAVVPAAPSGLSTTVGGIPVWILGAGALGAFFLLRRR
jgi:hypothetical protein